MMTSKSDATKDVFTFLKKNKSKNMSHKIITMEIWSVAMCGCNYNS